MPSFVYDLPSLEMVGLLSFVLVGSIWSGTIFLVPFICNFRSKQSGTGGLVGNVVSAHGVSEPFLLETPP
jgi:hypothetical protein